MEIPLQIFKHNLDFWQKFKNRISILNQATLSIPWPIWKKFWYNNCNLCFWLCVCVLKKKLFVVHVSLGNVILILRFNIVQHLGINCTFFVAWQDFFFLFLDFSITNFFDQSEKRVRKAWTNQNSPQRRHEGTASTIRTGLFKSNPQTVGRLEKCLLHKLCNRD